MIKGLSKELWNPACHIRTNFLPSLFKFVEDGWSEDQQDVCNINVEQLCPSNIIHSQPFLCSRGNHTDYPQHSILANDTASGLVGDPIREVREEDGMLGDRRNGENVVTKGWRGGWITLEGESKGRCMYWGIRCGKLKPGKGRMSVAMDMQMVFIMDDEMNEEAVDGRDDDESEIDTGRCGWNLLVCSAHVGENWNGDGSEDEDVALDSSQTSCSSSSSPSSLHSSALISFSSLRVVFSLTVDRTIDAASFCPSPSLTQASPFPSSFSSLL